MNGSTITLPKKLFKDLWETAERFDQFQSEFEDFVLSRDGAFLSKMRKARSAHLKNRVSSWSKLKARYGLQN